MLGIVKNLAELLDFRRLGRPVYGRHHTEARVRDCLMAWRYSIDFLERAFVRPILVVKVAPVPERAGNFAKFLDTPFYADTAYGALRRAETIGRPIGDADWLKALEKRTGRSLAPARRGRKAQEKGIK
jgi:putative transposase